MHFGFMNVILLHSDHGHVLATHVAIFRVVRARVYTCLYTYVSQDQSTFQNHTVLVTIPVKR
jgi:hypothetical protein